MLAVSGGPDSVALLDKMYKMDKYEIAVVHFNHLTRGEASDGDESFVKDLALSYNVPFFVAREDVKKIAKSQGLSFQAAARDIRYNFFRRVAKEFGAKKISLAHHADDQTETVLFNLLRGSGLKGLGGMAPLNGMLARPLLETTRREIEEYLEENHIEFRTDESNAELYYTRNRLRHVVMPVLQNFNPNVSLSFSRTTEIIRADDHYLDKLACEYFQKYSIKREDGISFSCGDLRSIDLALRRRLILKALAEVAEVEKDFSYRHVEDIAELLFVGSGHSLNISHGLLVTTTYNEIHFRKQNYDPKIPKMYELQLNISGNTEIPSVGIITSEYTEQCIASSNPCTVFIDAETLNLPLIVRSRRPGDIFRPLGGNGRVKLKELFINLHIERPLRDSIPVVCDANGEILWIAGIRPSEKCKIRPGGKTLKLHFADLRESLVRISE